MYIVKYTKKFFDPPQRECSASTRYEDGHEEACHNLVTNPMYIVCRECYVDLRRAGMPQTELLYSI